VSDRTPTNDRPRYTVAGMVQVLRDGYWYEYGVHTWVHAWTAATAARIVLQRYTGEIVRWHSPPRVEEEGR